MLVKGLVKLPEDGQQEGSNMPIQIIPARRTFGAEFGRSLGGGLGQGLSQGISEGYKKKDELARGKKEYQAANDLYKQLTGGEELPPGLPPEVVKTAFAETFKARGKNQLIQNEQKFLTDLFKGKSSKSMGEELAGNGMQERSSEQDQSGQEEGGFDPSKLTPEQILQGRAINKDLGRMLESLSSTGKQEQAAKTKEERRQFEGERAFHTAGTKDIEKKISGLRESLPKKGMALDFARNAVETGDVNYFSLDKLADATGVDLFRTAKGAQLLTAGKENLLSNMSRVGAKAQNQWFEQRLNSMFPKIGQSREANLTTQEMLEGELAMDEAFLNEYDRLSEQDEKEFGFTRKDVEKRAQNNVKPIQKQIFNRTAYRMKEQEEVEKGLDKVKKEVGKNVSKGTPLTLAMAKLYVDKFGDNAMDVAKKNGYTIPTLEEFKTYRAQPREFREEL